MSAEHQILDDLPGPVRAELAALALRMRRAEGPVLRALNRIGGSVEDQLKHLPTPLRESLVRVAATVLEQVYMAAATIGARPGPLRFLPRPGPRMRRVAALATGAAGGAGGFGAALVELPGTVGLIFAAMQRAAEEEGFDPASQQVRLICLEILGSGGPGSGDDGVDTTFFGARLGLTGAAVHGVIARLAPRFATVLGQKLAGQAVPVLGAVAGAGINWLFMDYFQELARIRFALLRLARDEGSARIAVAFRAEMARPGDPPARAA